MLTGIKHKPNIEVRASQSKAKLLSFCLHNVLAGTPCTGSCPSIVDD